MPPVVAGLLLVAVASACSGEASPRADALTALQVELLERGSADQAIRDTVFGQGLQLDPVAVARMNRVDSANAAWLKEQIRLHGWPSPAKVGKAAGNAAFLIVQHAVHDPAFQRMMLDTITRAFERGEVDGQSYALLHDRVSVQSGGRQRYGTQARIEGTHLVFEPMEDSLRVDSLRATVGLPSLEVYRRTMDSVYFHKGRPEP
jgi:hypothetical protein